MDIILRRYHRCISYSEDIIDVSYPEDIIDKEAAKKYTACADSVELEQFNAVDSKRKSKDVVCNPMLKYIQPSHLINGKIILHQIASTRN